MTTELPATGPGAPCSWCAESIPPISPETGRKTRRDAKTCSKRCRQSSWRFGDEQPHVSPGDPGRPRRFAYADPPYPGMSKRHYADHPDYAGEVDHVALIDRLLAEYPDGWALSTSSKTLDQLILLLAERGHRMPAYRIGAWTKPAPPSKSKRPRDSWEPVIFMGGRPRPSDAPTVLNWVHAAPPRTFPGQITGIKPGRFSYWLFDSLFALPGDTLDDLFPGSGAVGVAWRRWTRVDAGDASPVDRAA